MPRGLVYFFAFAFLVQGIIAPAHFHGLGQHFASAAQADTGSGGHDGGNKQTPAKSHSNCPICFASQLTSTAMAPIAPALSVPRIGEAVHPDAERIVVALRVILSWQSRAPPLA